jgi:2-oxoisovalerate dehydrogenase E1 component alpha subunit
LSNWHDARESARANLGQALIEYATYGAGAHSTPDDPLAYRPLDEMQAWPLGDPLARLKTHLVRIDEWSPLRHTQAQAEIDETLLAAQTKAEEHGTSNSGPHPTVRDMFEDVFDSVPDHLRRQRCGSGR